MVSQIILLNNFNEISGKLMTVTMINFRLKVFKEILIMYIKFVYFRKAKNAA